MIVFNLPTIMVLIGFVFVLVCATIDGGKVRRVVNGKLITKGEWPSLVSLHYLKPHRFTANTQMKHMCGGTLIDPLWVVTAAHCVSESTYPGLSDVGNWQVVLGEHNQYIKDDGEQVRTIDQVYVYPEYDLAGTNSVHHDIALLRLSEPVQESAEVSVIDMNEDDLGHEENDTEMMCIVGGWGQIAFRPYGWGIFIPLKADVSIINQEYCSKQYADLNETIVFVVDETTLCAGVPKSKQGAFPEDNNNDACLGDSGGPLVCQSGPNGEYKLTGIVSIGYDCGHDDYPGIYTRVTYYRKWIDDTIKGNRQRLDNVGWLINVVNVFFPNLTHSLL